VTEKTGKQDAHLKLHAIRRKENATDAKVRNK